MATNGEKRICPITSKELGAHTRAVYIVPCGHAFSEVAIKEVAGDTCLQCSESYNAENLVPILPLAKEDITRLAERMQKLKNQGLTHSLKKTPGGRKRKKDVASESTDNTKQVVEVDDTKNEKARKAPATEAAEALMRNGVLLSQSRSNSTTPLSGIKNAATASLTARVLDEQEKNKRRRLGLNENLKSLFARTESDRSTQKKDDFMTRGYSIPRKT
jgi:Rtf2 RING-finger